MPLSREHLPTVVDNWKYVGECGRERILRALEFAADRGLCYGTFFRGQLASWVVTTRFASVNLVMGCSKGCFTTILTPSVAR